MSHRSRVLTRAPPSKARVLNWEGYKDSSKASLFVGAEDKPCRIKAKGTQIKTRPRACDSGSIPGARTSCSPSPRAPQIKSPSSPGAHITHQRCVATSRGACALPQLAHAGGIGAVRVLLLQPAPRTALGFYSPRKTTCQSTGFLKIFFWTTIKMSCNEFIWNQSRINTSNIVSHTPAVPCRPHSHSPAGTRPLSLPESSAHATG